MNLRRYLMFPFHTMPRWSQWIGDILPLTHFLHVTRGALLKGIDGSLAWSLAWPIALFAAVILVLALVLIRRTVD